MKKLFLAIAIIGFLLTLWVVPKQEGHKRRFDLVGFDPRGIARRATPDLNRPDGKSALVFGPYTRLYPGRYRLDFLMKTEGAVGSGPLATVDVFSHLDGYPRASREVTAADFPRTGVWTPVTLEFDLDKTVDDLEFRVLYGGEGELWLDAIQVTPVAVQLPPELTRMSR